MSLDWQTERLLKSGTSVGTGSPIRAGQGRTTHPMRSSSQKLRVSDLACIVVSNMTVTLNIAIKQGLVFQMPYFFIHLIFHGIYPTIFGKTIRTVMDQDRRVLPLNSLE